MCSPTHLNVVLGFQCDVKTHHRQQVLLSFRPYLLRELMNFSLARLLTSFEVPSSGLLHLLTPVAGVCSPERKQMGDSFACVVESEFLPPFRGQPIGAKEPFTPFLKMEWGEIPQRVKLYCERTDLTRKLDGRASHFQAKLHFTTSFTFKKGKLKVKFTLFGKYFQSKIQFQDKNIHKPISPPHPPISP